MILEVSAIIATANRSEVLARTLESVAGQSDVPREIIIIDASEDSRTEEICGKFHSGESKIVYEKALIRGAAAQRQQGLALSGSTVIWFLDDDIILEQDCTRRIWNGFNSFPDVGAVNAMITNQKYTNPGRLTQTMYRIMSGENRPTYAGRIIGPAWNLLPEDREDLPEYVKCEWLNTTCTMYKKNVLPSPLFSSFFTGYSLMEDVALSATIARRHSVINARTARIYHDSQPGKHKNNAAALSRMEFVNRFYVMKYVLGRSGMTYTAKLILLQLFGVITSLRFAEGRKNFLKVLWGKFSGAWHLITTRLV